MAKIQKTTVLYVWDFFYFFSSEHFLWFSRSFTLLRILFYYLVLDTQGIIREHGFTQQILFAFCFLFKPLIPESCFFPGFLSHHIKKNNTFTWFYIAEITCWITSQHLGQQKNLKRQIQKFFVLLTHIKNNDWKVNNNFKGTTIG